MYKNSYKPDSSQEIKGSIHVVSRKLSKLEQNIESAPNPDMKDSIRNIQQNASESESKIKNSCMHKSSFGKDKDHCLCATFRPILKLCQLFGILPISHDRNTCQVSHSWTSIPALINIAWNLVNLVGGLFWYPRFYRFVRSTTQGTDFYTNIIMATVQLISGYVMFISGNINAIYFTKAWSKLHDTVSELESNNFIIVKWLVWLIPAYLLQEFAATSLLTLAEAYWNDWDLNSDAVQLRTSGFLVNFIPNLSTLTFGLLFYIISSNFDEINRELNELGDQLQSRSMVRVDGGDKPKANSTRGKGYNEAIIVYRLARLRILHENLCESGRRLESAFGMQILAVFAGTGVSFVIGVYKLTITSMGDVPTQDVLQFIVLLISNGLMPIYAGIRIMLVIVCCQMLMNNGNKAGNILSSFQTDDASDQLKAEVAKFHYKIGMFPVCTSALGVFDLGSSFVASATGNVVTYVLVLMQFNLSEPSGPAENGNGTLLNGTSP